MKKNKTFKITLCAILTALSAIAFYLENLFPPLLAGARLGLSNIFILLCAIFIGSIYGYFSLCIKILIGSFFASNPSSIMYSLPAGILALTIELLIIHNVKYTSIICASVVGAVINSLVQNLVFCLVTNTQAYLVYLPYLSLISVISGLIVGFCVFLLIKRIPTKYFS